MAIQNPTKYVSVQRLGRFEQKLAAKYATKGDAGVVATIAESQAAAAEITFVAPNNEE